MALQVTTDVIVTTGEELEDDVMIPQGAKGWDGWTPQFGLVPDGKRVVMKVTGWVGGQGQPPGNNVYVGESGLTSELSFAINVRGEKGPIPDLLDLGIDKIDNTPDAEKPVSQPQKLELDRRPIFFQTIADLRAAKGEYANQRAELSCHTLPQFGGGGSFYWHAADNTSVDDNGFVIGSGNGRWKRLSDRVAVEMFGAMGDYNMATGTGTNNTPFVQKAIDYRLARNGGGVEYGIGAFLHRGTNYINPTKQIPISITGATLNCREYSYEAGKGTAIVRDIDGDVFRVNLDENGKAVLPAINQYFNAAFSGLSFIGVGTGLNYRVAIKTFRTRGYYKNLFMSRMRYLVEQPLKDQSTDESGQIVGIDNYCDMSTFEELKFDGACYGGVKLNRCDVTKIDGFFYENPQSTAMYGIEVDYGSTLLAQRIQHWSPTTYAATAGAAFIRLNACKASSLINLHIERCNFESIVSGFYNTSTRIFGVVLYHGSNDVFRFDNAKGVDIFGYENDSAPRAGYYDLRTIGSYEQVQDIIIRQAYLLSNGAARTLTRMGTLGKTNTDFLQRNVTDLNSISGNCILHTAVETLNQPVAGMVGVGMQFSPGNVPSELVQVLYYGQKGYTRSRVASVWSAWIEMLTSSSKVPRSNVVGKSYIAGDADFEILEAGSSTLLPPITANRNLILPVLGPDVPLTIFNPNYSSFNWITSRLIRDNNGVDTNILPKAATVTLRGDINGNTRIESQNTGYNSNWKYTYLTANASIDPVSQNEFIETESSSLVTHALLANAKTAPGTQKTFRNSGTANVVLGFSIGVTLRGSSNAITILPGETYTIIAASPNTWRLFQVVK